MPDERFYFPLIVENIVRGIAPLTGEDVLKKHLLKDGVDVDNLPPGIAVPVVHRILTSVALLAFPGVPVAEGVRRVGLYQTRGWTKTLVGSAASVLIKLIGPKRALSRLNRALRTSSNYHRSETVFANDTEALTTFFDIDGFPEFSAGVLEGGCELVGVRGVVTIESIFVGGYTLRVKWT